MNNTTIDRNLQNKFKFPTWSFGKPSFRPQSSLHNKESFLQVKKLNFSLITQALLENGTLLYSGRDILTT